MKRVDLEVGQTYLVEDRRNDYEAIVISLDGEDWVKAKREVGEWRYSSRVGKNHVIVAGRMIWSNSGEVWYPGNVTDPRSIEWRIMPVTLAKIKHPLDMDVYRAEVAEAYRERGEWIAQETIEMAAKQKDLQEVVDKANAVLGVDAFKVYAPREGSGIPRPRLNMSMEAAEVASVLADRFDDEGRGLGSDS